MKVDAEEDVKESLLDDSRVCYEGGIDLDIISRSSSSNQCYEECSEIEESTVL